MKKWWTTLSNDEKILTTVALLGLIVILGAISIELGGVIFGSKIFGLSPADNIVVNRPPNPSVRYLLWRISELIAIPVTLGLIAYIFNQRQQERELKQREQADRLAMIHSEENALQNYIDRMSELLLNRNIRMDEQRDQVCNLARTRTLTVLRRLTEDRKSSVVRFLYEARLIDTEHPLVDLSQANLYNISLYKASLAQIDLHETRLNGSNLSHADLSGSNLAGASLTKFAVLDDEENEITSQSTRLINTKLTEANLTGANLRGSNIRRANLQRANLSQALLSEANFGRADLTDASLAGARLEGTDFSQANLTGVDFSDAIYDAETRWPDGFDIEATGAKFVKE